MHVLSPRTLFGDDGDVLYERQFQLLVWATLLVAVGVALVSPILESLTGPFGVSSAAIGQLVAAYVAPGIVVVPVSGLLADRYGRKPLVVFGLVVFGLAGAAIALTTDFRVVLGLRFLQGLGSATLSPVIITALGDLYDGAREATAQGIRFTAVGVGQAAIPPISGFLVGVGWQYPFLLYALTVPVGLAVWAWFDEPTAIGSARDATADADERSSEVDDSPADVDDPAATRGDAVDDAPADGRGQLRALAALATKRRVLAVMAARMVPTAGWYAVLTYSSILVVSVLGGSPAIAGTLVAATSLAKAVAATQVGRATAVFPRRVDLLLVVHVLLGAGLVVAGFAPSFVWAGAGFVAVGLGLGITMSVYRSVMTSFAPEHLRGGMVSVSETWGKVTATAVPVLMGVVVLALAPSLGRAVAVRWTLAGVGLVGVVIAVPALLLAIRSPAVSPNQTID